MPQPPKLFAKKDSTPPPPPSRHFNDETSRVATSADPSSALNQNCTVQRPSQGERPTDIMAGRNSPNANASRDASDQPRPPFKFPESDRQFVQPDVAAYSPDQPTMPRAPYEAPRTASTNSEDTNARHSSQNGFGNGFPSSNNNGLGLATTMPDATTFGGGALNSRFGSSLTPNTSAATAEPNGEPNSRWGGFGSNGSTDQNVAGAGINNRNEISGMTSPDSTPGILQPQTIGQNNFGASSVPTPRTDLAQNTSINQEVAPPVREYRQTPYPSFAETQRIPTAPDQSSSSGVAGLRSTSSPTANTFGFQPVSHIAEIPVELKPNADSYAPGSLSRLNTSSPWR